MNPIDLIITVCAVLSPTTFTLNVPASKYVEIDVTKAPSR